MAEQKQTGFAPALADRLPDGSFRSPATERRPVATDGKDVGNFDSYRRWLSRVQLPDKRRVAMDPSLYTWKGYRNWAEKVRRDWTPDE